MEWPAPFSWLMTVAHMLWRVAAFDFVPFLVGGCVGGTTYFTEIIGGVCSVGVWLAMIIAFATVNPFKQEDMKQRGLKMLWIVTFTNYVSLSHTILGTFMCTQLGPGCELAPGDRNEPGQNSTMCARILEADYQIDCESVEYYPVQGMAVLLLLIVNIGVPTVLVAVIMCDIWTLRCTAAPLRSPEKFHGVTAERKGHPLFDRYEFLQAGYKSVFYLWAVWELFFVYLVSGALIFFNPGSGMQVRSENES